MVLRLISLLLTLCVFFFFFTVLLACIDMSFVNHTVYFAGQNKISRSWSDIFIDLSVLMTTYWVKSFEECHIMVMKQSCLMIIHCSEKWHRKSIQCCHHLIRNILKSRFLVIEFISWKNINEYNILSL